MPDQRRLAGNPSLSRYGRGGTCGKTPVVVHNSVPMRVLLSTIGSRGDVQPLVALATELRELGQEVRLCAPPDFRDWIQTLGIPFVPVGPEVRPFAISSPPVNRARPSPEQMRQIAEATAATQFEVIPAAAAGRGIPLGGGALETALP